MILKKKVYFFFIFICLQPHSIIIAKTQTVYPFDTLQDQKKFDQLINQTRCLVCKNQTIAESQTSLAKDLRNKIYEQVKKGYSSESIQTYLAARYGDFILFEPVFKPSTYTLWVAPIAFLLIGLFSLLCLLRKKK